MKKLLIIAPSFHPLTGGVENHIKSLINPLKNRDYIPTVLVRHHPGIPAKQRFDGVEVIRLPNGSLGLMIWMLTKIPFLRSFDVIHSHDYFPYHIFKILESRRWVHTFHGYEGYPISQSAIESRQNVRKLVKTCFGVGRFIEKWYGTHCEEWIYGATEPTEIQPKDPKKWDVVFYGRLEEDTGIKTYLEGFKLIARSKPHDKMLVVGSGSLQKDLIDYCKTNKLNVEFMPFTNDVLKYAAESKVAFVSGYLALIECAAIGLPIVSVYDTPIKKDYLELHPMSTYFNISKNAEEVCEAYLNNLPNKSHLDIFQEWAKKQTWDEVADMYVKYYEQ